jgi:hypothetical protein
VDIFQETPLNINFEINERQDYKIRTMCGGYVWEREGEWRR